MTASGLHTQPTSHTFNTGTPRLQNRRLAHIRPSSYRFGHLRFWAAHLKPYLAFVDTRPSHAPSSGTPRADDGQDGKEPLEVRHGATSLRVGVVRI
ncbi:uncharacterized protein G6M90_00g026070 [Metarhizium brunneum]|uniref:Uncharacterized protein n=1 Tax=Metarhizium brunneum TaxID=500148 RepID=A0A7D5YQX6_9HYPO|nr:hypothetical protein G6M90_00g026070 [Metarhizium brunneum]